jgi:hypothetical protein
MGGDAGSMLGNIAGRALGVLSALPSRGGGFSNLANYMARRQAALADPEFRATLGGSPFSAGFYQVGGGMQPTPGYYAPVASPKEFMGPMMPTPAGPMDYVPGGRVWQPDLPPLSPKLAVAQAQQQGILTDLQSPDVAVRTRAKMAAGVPLTGEEQQAAEAGATGRLAGLPPGSTITLDVPGQRINVGSPYAGGVYQTPGAATIPGHLPPVPAPGGYGYLPGAPLKEGEYITQQEALTVRQPNEQTRQTSRGTWENVKVEMRPVTLPPIQPPAQPAAQPPTPPPAQPGAPAPVQPTPPPPPPPQPAPRAAPPAAPAPPAAAAPTWDPNQVVPHVIVPEAPAAPAGGAPPVGYPSPAFATEAAPAEAALPPPPPAPPAEARAMTPTTGGPPSGLPVYPAQGFVFHHSGGSTLEGLRTTLHKRGLGSQYLMDRDGTIYSFAGAGSPHIRPNDQFGGIAPGLSNKNAVGMEIVAKNDQDITPAQVASARNFIATNYPNVPVYGHGEVNPGHKMADEGLTVVNAIRADRGVQPGTPVPRRAPNTVDLNAPFFRQVEASRGLPPGTLSAMADKESSGNPLAKSPVSSASGLYGITKDTARAWGMSADDRFDPVKSTLAVADTLAARARDVGFDRAIGMHYGGPGAPWEEKVGPSGLSPAQYSQDVQRRAAKYAPPPAREPGVVAFPSPAFAEAGAAPRGLPATAQVPVWKVPAAAPLPPPVVPVAPPVPPAAAPGEGGTTLEGVTETSQEGKTRTYGQPSAGDVDTQMAASRLHIRDLRTMTPEQSIALEQEVNALRQRRIVAEQEARRLTEGTTGPERSSNELLLFYRNRLNAFDQEFPDRVQQDAYLDPRTRGWESLKHKFRELGLPVAADPGFERFHNALGPFREADFTGLDPRERALLRDAPTGQEDSPTDFQDKKQRFSDNLNDLIAWRLATQNLPRAQLTNEVWDSFMDNRRQQRAAQLTARQPAAAAPAPPAAAPPAPPPPAAEPWTPAWIR